MKIRSLIVGACAIITLGVAATASAHAGDENGSTTTANFLIKSPKLP